tara:strand:+ start:537 stop:665 length:129 start_codon:yes stop_codon:yes gene_type:complete
MIKTEIKKENARIDAKGYFPPKREIKVYYKGVCISKKIAKEL